VNVTVSALKSFALSLFIGLVLAAPLLLEPKLESENVIHLEQINQTHVLLVSSLSIVVLS